MSEYIIKPRTKLIAKENNLIVEPAKNKKYKIDVYDNKKNFITNIGASSYLDYPTYLLEEQKGKVKKGYADIRKNLYLNRHKNDDKIKGKLSKLLLWS